MNFLKPSLLPTTIIKRGRSNDSEKKKRKLNKRKNDSDSSLESIKRDAESRASLGSAHVNSAKLA